MKRTLSFLSMAASLAAGAAAQCLAPLTGTSITPGIVPWTSSSGYAATQPATDEGLTSPPIAMTAITNFPMVGAIGNLDQIWVNTNGEVYLMDSTAGALAPADGALFGVSTLAEMRGDLAGASPRIVVCGDDHAASTLAGAAYDVLVDQSVPGQIRISWKDVSPLGTVSSVAYTFSCTLFGSGDVLMEYGDVSALTDTRYVGLSIGNNVGSTTSPEFDLSAIPNSGTEGLIYQAFGTTDPFDLQNRSILFSLNGTGGYVAVVLCMPAFHEAYGAGCYDRPQGSVYEQYPDSASAKATLDGNAVLFVPTVNGYSALWVPAGAGAYIPPSGGAATVPIATANGAATLVPSVPFPIPGGSTAVLTVSENGIVTCSGSPNNTTSATPSGATMTTSTTAPDLGFYCWHDFTLLEAGSGVIRYEEVASGPDTLLCVTWDGVESAPTTTANPAIVQFQFNLNTGTVLLAVPFFDPGTSTVDTVVGVTTAGLGANPGSMNLPTSLPLLVATEESPTVYQLFADQPTTKAALDGNAMTAAPTLDGYVVVWAPGGGSSFLAPTGAATTHVFTSNGAVQVSPSVAFPTPYGPVPTLTISENGILTAGPAPNNTTSATPSGTSVVAAAAPELGFYCWRDFTLSEAGSGPIQTEEVVVGSETLLCVTWNGVEAAPSTSANPSTFQFQLNLNTGVVQYVWVSWDSGTSTSDTLIGLTLPGTSTDGTDVNIGSVDLATALPVVLKPLQKALELSGSPAPVITGGGTGPATLCTYTVHNVPEFDPTALPGIGACNLLFSVGPPITTGIDLGSFPVDIGLPGCRSYLSSADAFVDVSGVIAGGPGGTLSFSVAMPQPLVPGLEFHLQALALLPAGTPATGSNNLVGTPYGARTSNGLKIHYQTF